MKKKEEVIEVAETPEVAEEVVTEEIAPTLDINEARVGLQSALVALAGAAHTAPIRVQELVSQAADTEARGYVVADGGNAQAMLEVTAQCEELTKKLG